MSDIERSTQRLGEAVARLEAAARNRGSNIELADADRTRLEQELATLRADFARLRETSSGVSARLDTAIGRLKTIIGDDA